MKNYIKGKQTQSVLNHFFIFSIETKNVKTKKILTKIYRLVTEAITPKIIKIDFFS